MTEPKTLPVAGSIRKTGPEFVEDVKRVRNEFGCGLVEAKNLMERLGSYEACRDHLAAGGIAESDATKIARLEAELVEANRRISEACSEADAHYQPQIDQGIRDLNAAHAYAKQISEAAKDLLPEIWISVERLDTYCPYGGGALRNVGELLDAALAKGGDPDIRGIKQAPESTTEQGGEPDSVDITPASAYAGRNPLGCGDVRCNAKDCGGGECIAEREDALTEARSPNSDWTLIWSGEHKAWWRPHRSGYTTVRESAGQYPRAEALDIVHRVGPEKQLRLDPVDEPRTVPCLGAALAMRVLQSDLYHTLDEIERGECDELIRLAHASVRLAIASVEEWVCYAGGCGHINVASNTRCAFCGNAKHLPSSGSSQEKTS